MGRAATVLGIALSIAAAYVATSFNNILDLLQLVFAFVNAPLFATFALGMDWKRTTGHAAFIGLLSGTVAAAIHPAISRARGAVPAAERHVVLGGWVDVRRGAFRYPDADRWIVSSAGRGTHHLRDRHQIRSSTLRALREHRHQPVVGIDHAAVRRADVLFRDE